MPVNKTGGTEAAVENSKQGKLISVLIIPNNDDIRVQQQGGEHSHKERRMSGPYGNISDT